MHVDNLSSYLLDSLLVDESIPSKKRSVLATIQFDPIRLHNLIRLLKSDPFEYNSIRSLKIRSVCLKSDPFAYTDPFAYDGIRSVCLLSDPFACNPIRSLKIRSVR